MKKTSICEEHRTIDVRARRKEREEEQEVRVKEKQIKRHEDISRYKKLGN